MDKNELEQVRTIMRPILMAIFLHARITRDAMPGDKDAAAKNAREMADAVLNNSIGKP